MPGQALQFWPLHQGLWLTAGIRPESCPDQLRTRRFLQNLVGLFKIILLLYACSVSAQRWEGDGFDAQTKLRHS